MKKHALLVFAVLLVPTLAFALAVGDKAPVFEGMSTHGPLALQDYFGKKYVILAFYFKDFTPG